MKYHLTFLVLTVLTLSCGVPSRILALEADRVYPDSTKGFFSISDVERLVDQWRETQFGLLMEQPEMQEFWVDLRRQLGSRLSGRLGLTLEDLRFVPSGEIAGGLIAPVGQKPGFIFLLEVSSRVSETEAFLKELEKKFEQRKATKSTLQITGETASVFTFASADEDLFERQAVYLLTHGHLLVSDQIYLVDLIAKRLKGDRSNSLADIPAYTEVMKRCAADLKTNDTEPVIRWYVQPLELGEAIRAIVNVPERGRARTSPFKMLADVGFDAILGIGGTVDLKANELETVHRTSIYAPQPYRSSMNMLAFRNDTDFTSPPWVPEEIAGTTTLYIDTLEMFDHFGPLFDAMFTPGGGGWDSIIEGMRVDPYGLQIDIREELVQLLGRKILFFTEYSKPITVNSENLFIAVSIKEGKTDGIREALHKLIPEEDPDFERRMFNEYLLWQKRAQLEIERPVINIGGNVPPLPGGAIRPVAANPPAILEEKDEPFFPTGTITIAFDHILFSSNVEYLEKILTQESPNALEKTKDYKAVLEEFQSSDLGRNPYFLQSFARSAEAVRPAYEMIRQGKMPQSKSVLGQVLNLLLTPPEMEDDEVRPTRIDGSKMPEFDTIQQFFGPSGLLGVAEENGWFFKGFSLKQPE